MPFELPRSTPLSEPVVKEKLALAASEVLKTISRVNACVAGIRVNVPGYKSNEDDVPVVAAVVSTTPHGVTVFPSVLPPLFLYTIFEVKVLNPPVAVLALFPQKSSYPVRVLKSKKFNEPEE